MDHPAEIMPALKRGIKAVREGKPALVDVSVAWQFGACDDTVIDSDGAALDGYLARADIPSAPGHERSR